MDYNSFAYTVDSRELLWEVHHDGYQQGHSEVRSTQYLPHWQLQQKHVNANRTVHYRCKTGKIHVSNYIYSCLISEQVCLFSYTCHLLNVLMFSFTLLSLPVPLFVLTPVLFSSPLSLLLLVLDHLPHATSSMLKNANINHICILRSWNPFGFIIFTNFICTCYHSDA